MRIFDSVSAVYVIVYSGIREASEDVVVVCVCVMGGGGGGGGADRYEVRVMILYIFKTKFPSY